MVHAYTYTCSYIYIYITYPYIVCVYMFIHIYIDKYITRFSMSHIIFIAKQHLAKDETKRCDYVLLQKSQHGNRKYKSVQQDTELYF